jgi:hypothetical protein
MRENFGKGMGGHQSARMAKDEWLTPPELLRALGEFDLDPCAPILRPWDTAKHHFTIKDDGFSREWFGRVWLNPPYGQNTSAWLEKLSVHGSGVALVFARTETKTWFNWVWSRAQAVLFLAGRLNFHHVSGQRSGKNCGAPCALIAYGSTNAEILRTCGVSGQYIPLIEKRTLVTPGFQFT